ncbi:MAG: hypothetical protein P1U56_18730 [Saprospiraceae bacterium]|nr:hypothetical protein [Saprospiraceae bacterium]
MKIILNQLRRMKKLKVLYIKCLVLACLFGLASCNAVENSSSSPKRKKLFLGTKQFIWVDSSRVDPDYGGFRMVNTQVWYPSPNVSEKSERASYYYEIDKAAKELPYWSDADVQLAQSVMTNSFFDRPLLEGVQRFPLILFSPGLGCNLSQYTFYAEYLANQGYLVMGINHLHESEYVLSNENRVYPSNQAFHDSLKTLKIPEEITADAYRMEKGKRHKVLAEDMIFSLNQLIHVPFFKNRINVENVGTFGHSIGGAAAVYASILDNRIQSVIDLDGTPPGIALNKGIDVKFLFLEDLTDYKNHQGYAKMHQRRSDFCALNRKDSWRILIGESNHNSFLDTNYFLAENEESKKKSLQFLTQSAQYMSGFYKAQFYGIPFPVKPSESDSLEIIHFKK